MARAGTTSPDRAFGVADEAAAQRHVEALAAQTTRWQTRAGAASLAWRRIGQGPDLLLVHGGNGSWLHWVRNLTALAQRHTVWLPDLPGCGDSDMLALPTTLASLVDALQQGLDQLPVQRDVLDVVAFSFGSVIASHLALARPSVRRLALLGPTGHGLPRAELPLKNWRLSAPGPAQDAAHRHNLSQLMLHGPSAVDALALHVHRSATDKSRLRSKAISRSDATRQALDRLAVPVLMLWGEHDPTAPVAQAMAHFSRPAPERRCRLLPGVGHWVQYQAADTVNTVLADWLKPLPGAGGVDRASPRAG